MAIERLQKILARAGVASRRAAEELIVAGRVRVNGHIVKELGAKADPARDRVEIDGRRAVAEKAVYLVLHKPRGVVSTMNDPEGRPTVRELLTTVGARAYPVGRLDFATSGVLLVTNDGAFADGLLHPRRDVPKTYVLKVQGEMKPEDVDRWRKGVRLEDGVTRPAEASLLRHEGGKTWLEVTLREGRNQQIRRMGDATGFPVMRLARVAFAGITAEGLRPGQFRALTREELVALRQEYGVPKKLPSAYAVAEAAAARPARPTKKRSGPSAGPRRGPARGHDAERSESRSGRSEERAARRPRGEGNGPRVEREARGPRVEREARGPRVEREARGPRVEREARGPRRPR